MQSEYKNNISTQDLEKRDQFDFFSQTVTNFYSLSPVKPIEDGYEVNVKAMDFRGFSLVHWNMDPVDFHHTKNHLALNGLDHWILTLVLKGRIDSVSGGNFVQEKQGDLTVKSFGKTFSGVMRKNELISFYLSRNEFQDIAAGLDALTNKKICSTLTPLVTYFMKSTAKLDENLTSSQIEAVRKSFSILIRAAIQETPDIVSEADPAINVLKFNIVKDFIKNNIGNRGLNTEFISENLKISKRSLQYLFKERGGVSAYIKSSRLEYCYRALMDSSDKRLVSTIANDAGFTSPALFSRQFKEIYGFTPTEMRNEKITSSSGITFSGDSFLDLLLRNK
jgi:AraC-like DNA-binding protein